MENTAEYVSNVDWSRVRRKKGMVSLSIARVLYGFPAGAIAVCNERGDGTDHV